MAAILFLLLTSSCHFSDAREEWVLKGLSPKKQKQKIIVLQKKLKSAQKEELQVKELVASLCSEIEEAELGLVRKEICRMEHFLMQLQDSPQGLAKGAQIDVSTLFLQEREILERLIESGPSPVALEAQGLLERALRMITLLSDELMERAEK